jgi:hypothetical protein
MSLPRVETGFHGLLSDYTKCPYSDLKSVTEIQRYRLRLIGRGDGMGVAAGVDALGDRVAVA